MAGHDIVVVGGSAGSIECIKELVSAFPKDLDVSVFVVIHFPRHGTSVLPSLLAQHTTLTVAHAVNGEKIERGRIYVAPPDHHLLIKAGVVRVTRGPLENSVRPAINPLFRTAAAVYGPRVVGIILSGVLDDGTAGLWEIDRAGGVALVQTPEEALFGDMPRNALLHIGTAMALPVREIGKLVGQLSKEPPSAMGNHPVPASEDQRDIAEMSDREIRERNIPGELANFTCPDCHGNLWVSQDGPRVRYECRVGHAYTSRSLEQAQRRDLEKSGVILYRSLEERRQLALNLMRRAEDLKFETAAHFYRQQANIMDEKASALDKILVPLEQDAAIVEDVQEQLRQLDEQKQDKRVVSAGE